MTGVLNHERVELKWMGAAVLVTRHYLWHVILGWMNRKGDGGGDKCELFPRFFSPVIPKRMGVAFSPIPHVSTPPRLPWKKKEKKKKKLRMEEGEGKNEVNYTTTRLSLQLPPLIISSVLQLVAPHERRSLHRAHRLQSVGMSAGGNDGTANRPAGRCSGDWPFLC